MGKLFRESLFEETQVYCCRRCDNHVTAERHKLPVNLLEKYLNTFFVFGQVSG